MSEDIPTTPEPPPGAMVDLFGEKVDEYATLKSGLGIWPVTVWPHSHQDASYRRLKELVGDDGSAREGVLHANVKKDSIYNVGASIFSPAVASWCLNLYAPTTGLCFDPFAGGGTRAIMAAKHGLTYHGTELRLEEVEAVRARAVRAGVADKVNIHHGDARKGSTFVGEGVADFLLTCPPYHDLEEYEGGEGDLSGCDSYAEFAEALVDVAREEFKVAKPGAACVWVIGLHRDKTGELLPLHHAVAAAHQRAGWRFKEEVILYHHSNGAIQRVGNFTKGQGFLIRVHEYVMVFTKPTGKK